MMKNWFASLLLLLVCTQIQAVGTPKYEVSKIPETLMKDAKAVVRADKTTIEIHDKERLTEKKLFAVTIFGETASEYTQQAVYYDQLSKVNYLEGRLYDKFGKLIHQLKKSDILDVAAFGGVTFVSDNRVKVAALRHSSYPFTVEFEYEVESKNTLFYPNWYPQPDRKVAIENSTFEIRLPKNLPELRYAAQHLNAEPVISEKGNLRFYEWTSPQLPAKTTVVPYAPRSEAARAKLIVAPSIYKVQGYEGNMATWESFGEWFNLLNKDRTELSEATQTKIRTMTDSISDTKEKIRVLYAYMQSQTRYVGVQLGIGGWQPFAATEVDSKGYGDCKALSNYMKALLAAIGVEAYYTLIRAGTEGEKANFAPDFPSSQFNHVILCVPVEQDTIWLECTSSFSAAGYMGNFTDDRYALCITPKGGKLVRTPSYTKVNNFLERKSVVQIDSKGNAKAEVYAKYSGLKQHEEDKDYLVTISKAEQKKALYEQIKAPNVEITDFDLVYHKVAPVPFVSEKINLNIPLCASKSGKRAFLQPNLFATWEHLPKLVENRTAAVQVSDYDFSESETVEFQFPKGYYLEHKPEPILLNSCFGTYQSSIEYEGDKLIYRRTINLNSGIFPAEKYQEWVEFCKEIAKADKQKVVFVEGA